MTMNQPYDAEQFRAALGETVGHHWGWFLFEGILLVILGIAAILLPVAASLAATVFFGWLLLLSGIMGLISTLRARRAPGFGWSLLSAVLGIGAGAVLLLWPIAGTVSLTAVLIAFLIAEGVITLFYALEHRKGLTTHWGWMLASGIVDIVLGLILLAGLPGTALWALGLLLGINLLFGGTALIMMALAGRAQLPGTGTPTRST
jgi:uncharacterized membrane protein HdeD (DUF308 family)